MEVKRIITLTIVLILLFAVLSYFLLKTQVIPSDKPHSLQILFIVLILTTILTFIGLGVNYKIVPSLKGIDVPAGKSGKTGKRGPRGQLANRLEKCDDNMCFRKIMGHITDVYNFWCRIRNITPLPEGKFINNKYIQGKVMEICDSEQLQAILKKNGAHKLTFRGDPINGSKICKIEKNCGAYDYIFQKWTEWILIILKYENGKDWLDSPLMTENEFNNLIHENDYKKTNEKWIFNDKETLGGYTMGMILSPPKEQSTEINNSFRKSTCFNFYSTQGVPSSSTITEKMTDEEKLNTILSPFEEIKKYEAWYWGADEYSIPKLINKCNYVESIPEKYTGKIKIKLTNDYIPLWTSDKQMQIKVNDNNNNHYIDGLLWGNKTAPVSIYRAREMTDENEKDIFFKNYKPVGDVIYSSTENEYNKKNIEQIMPIQNRYKYINTNKPYKQSGPLYFTIMVSGDVKPPMDYTLIKSVSRNEGFDKNGKQISIWRPVPPPGYISLGDIIDVSADSVKPDLNSIYCVHHSSVEKINSSNIESNIWSSKTNLTDKYNNLGLPKGTQIITDMTNTDGTKSTDFEFISLQHINTQETLKQIYSNIQFDEDKIDKDNEDNKKLFDAFLQKFNQFRCKLDTKDNPGPVDFYKINPKSLFMHSIIQTLETEIITRNKNPIQYSIYNIYNL